MDKLKESQMGSFSDISCNIPKYEEKNRETSLA
jgi:hypothetical protein